MPVRPLNRLILLVTVLFTSFFAFRFLDNKVTFYGDAAGYYIFLPQTFIYHNLTNYQPMPNDRGIPELILSYDIAHPRRDDKDTIFIQYTYGVAAMEAPFFLMAHAYEKATGGQANGFSHVYEQAIRISSIVYVLLGLILVYKILRRFFEETPAVLATVLLLLGTNLFWFTVFQAGMSHQPLFFLYALLIYLTIWVHDRPGKMRFAALGLVVGMITLIRPTDIVCVLIPLLYNVYSRETWREKLRLIQNNAAGVALAVVMFVLPIVPQLLFWKVMSGHYVYYSYGDQSFDWKHPMIIEGLFYFSNGWLPYSPLMCFAVAGIFLRKGVREWKWSMWLLLPVYIYIIYSWYCYRYINGLGSRPMLHMYPLLSVPLAAFITLVGEKRRWVQVVFGLVVLFCVALNIDYTNRQRLGILWSEESSFQFNWQTMFRTRLRYEDLVVQETMAFQPDTAKLVKLRTLAVQRYDDSVSDRTVPDPVTGHKYVYYLHEREHQSIPFVVPYKKEDFADAKWIKWSGRFLCVTIDDYYRHYLVAEASGGKLWKKCAIENKNFVWQPTRERDHLTLFDFKLNVWGPVYFYTKVPRGMNEQDILKLYVWSPNMSDIYVDDLCIELYK